MINLNTKEGKYRLHIQYAWMQSRLMISDGKDKRAYDYHKHMRDQNLRQAYLIKLMMHN